MQCSQSNTHPQKLYTIYKPPEREKTFLQKEGNKNKTNTSNIIKFMMDTTNKPMIVVYCSFGGVYDDDIELIMIGVVEPISLFNHSTTHHGMNYTMRWGKDISVR